MSLQATATPLVHEEMDIVKSPLIALMKDDVKEVTEEYSGSAVSRITFQMDKTCFLFWSPKAWLLGLCSLLHSDSTETDNYVFVQKCVHSATKSIWQWYQNL